MFYIVCGFDSQLSRSLVGQGHNVSLDPTSVYMPCKCVESRESNFWSRTVGDGRIPLDRALIRSYKLLIVTLSLSAAVGYNLQRDYLGMESVPRLRCTRIGGWEVVRGLN